LGTCPVGAPTEWKASFSVSLYRADAHLIHVGCTQGNFAYKTRRTQLENFDTRRR
jgi:hypothetical protein